MAERIDVGMTRKLYRIEKGRKLLGVCGGIAEYFGIDPSLIRLIWVVVTLVTAFWIGLVAYFGAGFILPNKSEVDIIE